MQSDLNFSAISASSSSPALAKSIAQVHESPTTTPHVLLTTSLLSRGLDFSLEIKHVFIVDEPCNLVDFLHRAGRVGRAGEKGKVVVFGVGGERRRAVDALAVSSGARNGSSRGLSHSGRQGDRYESRDGYGGYGRDSGREDYYPREESRYGHGESRYGHEESWYGHEESHERPARGRGSLREREVRERVGELRLR
ncbi:hypothetical protein C8J56DRAFT_1120269 [Mycena floridula]|nr:hypothetical protein C8J56DRAFT_1120269 [Mycena floridula]